MNKIWNRRTEGSPLDRNISICVLFCFQVQVWSRQWKPGTSCILKVSDFYFFVLRQWNRKLSFHVWQWLLGAYPMIAIKKFGWFKNTFYVLLLHALLVQYTTLDRTFYNLHMNRLLQNEWYSEINSNNEIKNINLMLVGCESVQKIIEISLKILLYKICTYVLYVLFAVHFHLFTWLFFPFQNDSLEKHGKKSL